MELKTLKDLEGNTLVNNVFVLDFEENGDTGYVLYNNPIPILKKEAIRWIKSAEQGYVDGVEHDIDFEEYKQRNGVWIWMKHFFNITDDDLK